MTLDSAEPDLSVIVTGQGPFAHRRTFGERLLELARGPGHSAELIIAATPEGAAVEEGIVQAIGRARGRLVAFCDPGSGLAPETLPALVDALADGMDDLAIAVCDQGQSGAGPATMASRCKALLARLLLWTVAKTADPWSRWYALRRDQLDRLAPPDRASAAALHSLLLGGPEMRSVDVAARRGAKACLPPALPTLREILARLCPGRFVPRGISPTGAQAGLAAAIGIAIDLLTTLALGAWGWLPGAANLVGFAIGVAAFLGIRAVWPAACRPAACCRRR